MGTLGDIGQVLSYGIGVGANSRADQLMQESEAIRKAGLERLKFNYGIQAADYKQNLNLQRDGINRDFKREERQRADQRWMMGEQNKNSRFNAERASKNNLMDKEYGYRFALAKMKNNAPQTFTSASKELDVLSKQGLPTSLAALEEMGQTDSDYNEYLAQGEREARGSRLNPFDNKEFKPIPYVEFAKKTKPQLFAAANLGERLVSSLVGGQQAEPTAPQPTAKPKKQIKSEAGLRQVVGLLEGKKGAELQQALKEMEQALDAESFKKVIEATKKKKPKNLIKRVGVSG